MLLYHYRRDWKLWVKHNKMAYYIGEKRKVIAIHLDIHFACNYEGCAPWDTNVMIKLANEAHKNRGWQNTLKTLSQSRRFVEMEWEMRANNLFGNDSKECISNIMDTWINIANVCENDFADYLVANICV